MTTAENHNKLPKNSTEPNRTEPEPNRTGNEPNWPGTQKVFWILWDPATPAWAVYYNKSEGYFGAWRPYQASEHLLGSFFELRKTL